MRRRFFLVMILLLIYLVGCSNQEQVDKEESGEGVKESANEETVETITHTDIFPLTGIGTNEEISQRPFAVMIENDPNARPQSGLHQADIVYETLAEGDVTRFMAIFQSEKPEKIGPVRSARDYYIDLSKGYDAFYVAHGFSKTAEERLVAGEVDNINGMFYDGTLFWRDESRAAPHNSYISYENIKKGAADVDKAFEAQVSPLSFLTEEEIGTLDGIVASDIKLSYSSRDTFAVEYRYNQQLEKYERYNNKEQTIDRETKVPVLLDNVFIVEMAHQVIDDIGRKEIDITTGGKGLLLQKGIAKEVQWKNSNGRIVPVINNEETGFIPGKTWINVIPNSPGIAGAVSYGN